VVDLMGEEFLGQSNDLRSAYETQIRQVYGLTDIFDSEMEDAGGLNNEGLEIEITDRSIAAEQKFLSDSPFDELLDILGYEDWTLRFVPPRETDLDEQRKTLEVLKRAAQLGLDATYEDGEPVIQDGPVEAPAEPEPGGGPGGEGDLGLDAPADTPSHTEEGSPNQ
jgi:hypothetical protein